MIPKHGDYECACDIVNPPPARWPYPEFVTPDMEGPMLGSLMPCGCHVRRPDYETVLCPTHLAELNADAARAAKCWRHDYGHREYVCRCDPPVDGDTGYQEQV